MAARWRPADSGHPVVFTWQPPERQWWGAPVVNVGDRLALDLVQRILASRGLSLEDYRGDERRVFCIGSLLRMAGTGDVIWGTGINGKSLTSETEFAPGLDLRAVRGPLTARTLMEQGRVVPAVYGDPGILVDRYWPMQPTGAVPFWVVPHFREPRTLYRDYPVLSPRQRPTPFLRQLVQARRVVSSSLHGLVLAEAYGIPAVPLKNQSGEHVFKYQDYYEGTGRVFPGFCDSVEEALRCEPPPGIPAGVKDRLLAAFPWDLWAPKTAKS